MKREITLNEVADAVSQYNYGDEPIIIKRKNELDLMIISVEEFNKRLSLAKLDKELEESEEEIKQGKVYNARDVFNELRQEYEY